MDPVVAHALEPFFIMVSFGLIPASIVFIVKYFNLKTRELDLEAELHGRDLAARMGGLEARQAAIEAAVTGIANALAAAQQQGRAEPMRAALAEPPPEEPLERAPGVRRLTER